MPANQSKFISLLLVVLVAWRLYRRFRQHVGRQELKTKRVIARVVIYFVFSLFFLFFSIGKSRELFFGWGAGVLTGLPLAWLGYHLTRLENTTEGRFFTPNPYIGIAMSLLLVGRLIYRISMISEAASSTGELRGMVMTPLTLYTFELIASYFTAYYTCVMLKCHSEPLPNEVGQTPNKI